MGNFSICVANDSHLLYATQISQMMEESAKVRGTGIAKRSPAYIQVKIQEGKAVIALSTSGIFAGFCYIESWGHKKFVANSGLIVNPEFRGKGLAKKIKEKAFELSRETYPNAKLFGLTTSLPVMRINSELGYKPVTFSELTDDEEFWKGCQSCVNYDILSRTQKKHCLCTGMLYDPHPKKPAKTKRKHPFKVYERWLRFKKNVFLKITQKRNRIRPEPELEKVKA